jgi:hypothetical protein
MRRLSDGWMDARWWCVDGFKLGVGWMQVGWLYGCKVGGWMDVRWVGGWIQGLQAGFKIFTVYFSIFVSSFDATD